MLALEGEEDGGEFSRSLRELAVGLPLRPCAIVVVSAHGLSPDRVVEVTAAERLHAVHDFSGFPKELYELGYDCPGSPELAARIVALLAGAGFEAHGTREAGVDHGVWIPLRVAFPEADIPVVQVSMPYPSPPERVLQLGRALAPLREEGVLLIGSGGLVHNLRKLVWHQKHGEPAPWAKAFDQWVYERLERRDVAGLLDFAGSAPEAAQAHPTPEHFFPLFFVLGASLPKDDLRVVHREIQYASLSMSCFALMPAATLR